MINIKITEEMKDKAYEFSKTIISGNNQYNRVQSSEEIRIQRTYAGKLAEMAFLEYIRETNSQYEEEEMFTIFNGQANVDSYDFIDENKNKYDIKAAFLPNHYNISIPMDQINNIPKNFYVGVKLNGDYADEKNDKQLLDVDSITEANIVGEISYESLIKLETKTQYGPPCKMVPLTMLREITFKY